MSIRNFIVIGIFGAITGLLYKSILPSNPVIPGDLPVILIVVMPIIIGISLAMIKPQFGTADSIILSLIYMSQNKSKKDKVSVKSNNKKQKSKVLGEAKTLKKEGVPDEDIVREIFCSDLDELKSIKINLYQGNSEPIKDTLVKCYLDELLIDTIRTTFDGQLVINIRPETAGKKELIIRMDSDDTIILKKPLLFKQK